GVGVTELDTAKTKGEGEICRFRCCCCTCVLVSWVSEFNPMEVVGSEEEVEGKEIVGEGEADTEGEGYRLDSSISHINRMWCGAGKSVKLIPLIPATRTMKKMGGRP
ncbi:MAG: hypothetical protein P4L50_28510, partial [Anaerolineaceae bacterium]|nr:hypothetical protein [Anaerolineaceae bacterium]